MAQTSNTRIERWATERNFAIAMPSGENSFYVDHPFGSSCFGDIRAARLTDKNPRVATEILFETKRTNPTVSIPKVYITCGAEDDLLKVNR